MLSQSPLRTKLLVAFGVPILILLGLTGLRVKDRIHDSSVAALQLEEIERVLAIESVANALRHERDVTVDQNATPEDLAAARAEADEALAEFDVVAGEVDAEAREVIYESAATFVELRDRFGDDPAAVNAGLQADLMTTFAESDEPQPMIEALRAAVDAGNQLDALLEFDSSAMIDGKAAADLSALLVASRLQEGLAQESIIYNQMSAVPAEGVGTYVSYLLGRGSAAGEATAKNLVAASNGETRSEAEDLLSSPQFVALEDLRDRITAINPGEAVPVSGAESTEIVAAAIERTSQFRDSLVRRTSETAGDARSKAEREAIATVVSVVVLGALLLLLIIALYRSIRRPLRDLTDRSRQVATVELPDTVRAMRSGDPEAVPELEPIAKTTSDEIGELIDAFNLMSSTAVQLAGEQAAARKVVADMFVNLGRRNHKLLGRMLKRLDALEQTERDADKLSQLYDIDHLATRMRRNAESLLVLAGANKTRRWKQPVAAGDVIRAALTEVEDYQRVTIPTTHERHISGDYVADTAHLLAELIENALTFSPPSTQVEVIGRQTEPGYLIAISDHGVGMTAEQLAVANERIHAAADESETPSLFLGHFVVGRLAARRGIDVELAENAHGGLTARVLLPNAALEAEGDVPELLDPAGRTEDTIDVLTHPVSAALAPTAVEDTTGSLLGPARRPGEHLPSTSIGRGDSHPRRRADDDVERNPDELRNSLAGFQSGTRQADREGE